MLVVNILTQLSRCLVNIVANGWRYEIVGDYGALHYQGTTTFDARDAICVTTKAPMFYTACCALVFCFSVIFSFNLLLRFCLLRWEQTHSLTSFGRAVGFLSDLAMCVAVVRLDYSVTITDFVRPVTDKYASILA
jgi:hypothetical protein